MAKKPTNAQRDIREQLEAERKRTYRGYVDCAHATDRAWNAYEAACTALGKEID